MPNENIPPTQESPEPPGPSEFCKGPHVFPPPGATQIALMGMNLQFCQVCGAVRGIR